MFLFFGAVPHVLAQGFVPLASIPGLTDIQPTQGGLAAFFNNLYKFAIGMAAVLAVIMIIWGGLEYSTQDSISKKSDGKQRIYQAIFGLVLVLSPVLVFTLINPSILNLSLNLQPLDTKSGWVGDTGTAVDAATAAIAAGCTVTDTGLVKTAICKTGEDSQRDAVKFAADCKKAGGDGRSFFLSNRFAEWKATCDMTPPKPAEETPDEGLSPS